MNQNINLYLPEFRKQRVWLDATRMLQWIAVVAVALALVSAWQIRLQKQRLAIAQEAEVESVELGNQVAELEAQLASVTAAQSLDAELETLQAQLREKQVLLNFLEGRELGNVAGFSEYMADLSRYHTPGLSLNRIVLRTGGAEVELSGQVLQPELVPLYLQSLRQGTMYVGKKFQTMTMGDQPRTTSAAGNTAGAPSRTFWNFSIAAGAVVAPAPASPTPEVP